ncbi:MAG: ATP-binding cassette domain-containing protein [Saprospiraceae bacterium]|nr:ATP-binding cassette domain-containing protein [Saprospiraceae bacterium]
MASVDKLNVFDTPLTKLLKLLKLERKEIGYIYFYAILAGLLQLSVPLGIQAIINFVLAGAVSTSMILLICFVVLGVFFDGFLQIKQLKVIEKIQQKVFARYSLDFAYRIPKLNLIEVDRYYLPELVNRFFDIVVLQKSLSKLLLDIPTAVIQLIFGLILLSLYANVFIIFSIILVIILIIIISTTARQGLATSLEESDYKYEVAGWLQEVSRVFKSFHFASGSRLPIDKTDGLVSKYIGARTKHFKVLLFQYWTLIGFKVLITAAMLILGSILLVNNTINVGQFVASEIVIITVLASIEKLIRSLDKVYDLLTSLEKLSKITDKPMETAGTLDLVGNGGIGVQFSNVNFGYTSDLQVLNDISFNIEKGQKVCIMGADGSGKSTLGLLLSGTVLSYDGNINFNGIPLGNYRADTFRGQLGLMFHNQDVFQGSLLENINLRSQFVTVPQIMQVARKIGFKGLITQFKMGFDEELDPTGRRLAISQKHKILLLRALVGNPSLLILEEPWERLDHATKLLIFNYIFNEIPDVTVFVISNDVDFAKKCDHVIVLDEGKIISQGTPTEIPF